MTRLIEGLTGVLPVAFNQDLGAARVMVDPLAHIVDAVGEDDPIVARLVVPEDLLPVELGRFVRCGGGTLWFVERVQLRAGLNRPGAADSGTFRNSHGGRTHLFRRLRALLQLANLERLCQVPRLVRMADLVERVGGVLPVKLDENLGAARVSVHPLADVVDAAAEDNPKVARLVVPEDLLPVELRQVVRYYGSGVHPRVGLVRPGATDRGRRVLGRGVVLGALGLREETICQRWSSSCSVPSDPSNGSRACASPFVDCSLRYRVAI